ncbi:MAG: ABC transporter substrate-binding protein, partial [Planctomycetia bacterium]|nr:ABC transporter substrate-binding protein [Planctomycetia bacterium]
MNQVLLSSAKHVRLRLIVWSVAVMALLCAAESYGDSPQTKKVNASNTQTPSEAAQCRVLQEFNVLFDSRPNVRAIGFLVAQEEGYYQEANLPPIKFSWNHLGLNWEELLSGKVQFIVSSFPRAVAVSSKTKRAIIISQLIEKTSLGLVFRTDCRPKTNRIQDFQKARIGVYKEDTE